MEDQPFGLSDTEFFALRTTTDNLGSHFESRHETFLVATNLETREQVMWHVDSVQITTIFGDRGDDDRVVGADILKDIMGSDHCPVSLDFN